MLHRFIAVALVAAAVSAQTTGGPTPFVPTIFPTESWLYSEPTWSFLGNNTAGPTWAFPTFGVAGGVATCTPGTANTTRYTPITLNISQAGAYQIAIQAELSLRSTISAFVVTKPDATTPFLPPLDACTLPYATRRRLGNSFGTSGGPQVNDFVHLEVGYYTLIVTSSGTASGVFAVNIWQAGASGSTAPAPVTTTTEAPNVTATTGAAAGTTGAVAGTTGVVSTTGAQPQPATGLYRWASPDSGRSCSIYDDDAEDYSYFRGVSVTTPAAAVVDIIISFDFKANNSGSGATGSSFVTVGALYQGDVNEARLAANPCDSAFNFVQAVRSSSGSFTVAFWNVSVTANTTYTLIVSGGQDDQFGSFGVFVRPTIVRSLITSPPFSQPERQRGPTTEACEDDTTTSSWYSYVFRAQYAAYLIDTGYLSGGFSNFDSYSFLYRGANNATPPTTCPLAPNGLVYDGDTGDVTPLYTETTPGAEYSVVISTYGSGNGNGDFALYVFSGTTVSADGTVIPNTGPTTAAVTGTTGGDTGAASSVVANIVLLAVAFVAALLA